MKYAGAVAVLACLFNIWPTFAQGPNRSSETPEEFQAKLGLRTGTVTLDGGIATINVPKNLRFIEKEGSRRLLTEAWGNPKDSADGVLGMLVPGEISPLDEKSWAVVITFDEEGYVKDADAGTIDYQKLLSEMREDIAAANKEREKEGYPTITLVGWAEPPHYDPAAHKLYWAKDLIFGDDSSHHILNYNIRILGRRGVLILNAVGDIDQLPLIQERTPDVLAAVNFNDGHKYSDYLPGDKTAAYGITGLIVGAAAAKAGFFKVLWVGILALKKFIIIGIAVLVGIIKKFFGRKETSSTAPPPIG